MNTNNSAHALYTSLLRPSILHILRAAGFQTTKSSVLDTVVDLAARHLMLLASTTASYSALNTGTLEVRPEDVRMAMEEVGCFRPSLTTSNEQAQDDDVRGVKAFLDWCKGPANQDIRRMAGMASSGTVVEVGGLGTEDDFLISESRIALGVLCTRG